MSCDTHHFCRIFTEGVEDSSWRRICFSIFFSNTETKHYKTAIFDVHGLNVSYSPPKNSYRTHFPSDSMSGIGTPKIQTNPLTDKSTRGRTKTPTEKKQSKSRDATSNKHTIVPLGRKQYIPGNSVIFVSFFGDGE